MIPIDQFQSKTPHLLALLTKLVEVESPSTDKSAVDRLGTMIAQEMGRLGAVVTVETHADAGNNIVGRWANNSEENGILILCHMDTVFNLGTLAQRPVRIENGRFYGPGALDMKAGIAIALTALTVLKDSNDWPPRPITFLCTSDEEIGSQHSRALIESLATESTLVLCLEPALPDGAVKTARKGTGDIEITAYGVAAHAGGDHARGVNAIEELSHHILAVQRLTDYDRGTTVSIGHVRGGTRSNVIPDRAWALADVRIMDPAEADRLRTWTDQLQPVLKGARVAASLSLNRPPMPRDPQMAETFQRVQAIGQKIGLSLTEGSTGGASDANFVAPLGIPVLDGLGPAGEGAHAEQEYVTIASLPERTALLAAILTEW